MRFRSGLKRRLDSFSTGYVQIIDLYFHPSCCPFDLIQHFGVFGLKDSHTGERGNNLLQKLDFFSAHLRFKCRQPSDIPLRSRQAGNETVANWSVVLAHHNGNRDACRLDSTGGRRSGGTMKNKKPPPPAPETLPDSAPADSATSWIRLRTMRRYTAL